MRGFGENLADGDRETDRNEWQFIGPNPPGGRRTKNQTIPTHQSEEKWENLIFNLF